MVSTGQSLIQVNDICSAWFSDVRKLTCFDNVNLDTYNIAKFSNDKLLATYLPTV